MFKAPSTIAKVETMSDGGMKLVINTQELSPENKAELMGLHNKIGWFIFAEAGNNITTADIPDEPIEFEGQKTYSERLRNVLFRLFEKQGGKAEDFEAYRARIMERLINGYKAKIDDYE